MTRRAVWAVGLGQCVSWGTLYYAFGVLIVPVEQELGVARWVVVGIFSWALLVSALVAPHVGKIVDRGHGPFVVRAGGLTAAGLLAVWAWLPNIYLSYVIWAAIGICMTAVLYEPIFAIVGRAIGHAGDRLHAIATITVFGGLASTVFLPLTGALVDRLGWREAVGVLAAGLAVTTQAVHWYSFSDVAAPMTPGDGDAGLPALEDGNANRPGLLGMVVVFTASSFAGSALAANLIPALIEGHFSPARAAALGGLFGVMQLPGRLVFMRNSQAIGPVTLLAGSLGLQVAGLSALVVSRSAAAVAIGVSLFACGSGLATIARPYLVLVFYGPHRAGHMNGTFARHQQLARAAGPVAAAALAGVAGYGVVFGALAALLTLVIAGLISSERTRSQPCRCSRS